MGEGAGDREQGAELQFDKVDTTVPDALRVCSRCQARFDQEYFEAHGNFICPACASSLSGGEEGGTFVRAAAYGAGAALVGTIVWFAILKITDYEFGLLAIAVGLGVGYAVRSGARGRGGWRYQGLAMLLTYASITASYVPLVIQGVQQADSVEDGTSQAEPEPGVEVAQAATLSAGEFAMAWALVFAIAFASPFLAGAENIMGLIIIGIGLYEAWKLNKQILVTGPYQIRAGPAPAAP